MLLLQRFSMWILPKLIKSQRNTIKDGLQRKFYFLVIYYILLAFFRGGRHI